MSAQKVGMEDGQADNNALRGHMMPVPVYGLWHCSPERRFCLPVAKHLNNVGRCPHPPHLYKYPHTVAQPYSPSCSGFFHLSILLLCIRLPFQASVSLGQLYPPLPVAVLTLNSIRFALLRTLLRTSSCTPSRFHLDIPIAGRFTFHVHAHSRISDFNSVFSLSPSR